MAELELHHKSHHHPLIFNKCLTSPSDTTSVCAGCNRFTGEGPVYVCSECRFFLHKKCAEASAEIYHLAHPHHPLLLLLPPASENQKRVVRCSMCYSKVRGFIYHCSSCEFSLDFNCALLPLNTAGNLIETLHGRHPHPLVSINRFRYYWLDGSSSTSQVEGYDASYACFDCRKLFDEQCLELPPGTNHPCRRTHSLLLVFRAAKEEYTECNLCQSNIEVGFYYLCVPCQVNIHLRCAWPPPIIEDKAHHDHPFTLLLKPNDPFDCNACDNRGNYVSYICSTCNIQVHKDCISFPRHIRLNLHSHPISHCFFPYIDQHDSRTWDCKICYKNVNMEHGSYYCSRPGCDFAIHTKCSIEKKRLYGVAEVENPDDFEEPDLSFKPMSCIVRTIKEIKVGDDTLNL